jgi:hypothetical protein
MNDLSIDFESLRGRVALLEDAHAKTCSDRNSLEHRIEALEQELAMAPTSCGHEQLDVPRPNHAYVRNHCQSAQRELAIANVTGCKNSVDLLTELVMFVAELPPGRTLHVACEQLQWLMDKNSSQSTWLQDIFVRLDHRVSSMERFLQEAEKRIDRATITGEGYVQAVEVVRAQFGTLRTLVESKADQKEQQSLVDTLKVHRKDLAKLEQACTDVGQFAKINGQHAADTAEQLNSLKTALERKAGQSDQLRLAETLKGYREDLIHLEQTCKDLADTVKHNDKRTVDLENLVLERDEEWGHLTERWGKRLWGYSVRAPSQSESQLQRRRPQSAGPSRPVWAYSSKFDPKTSPKS